MLIKSKYHGKCKKCGGSIIKGENIFWNKAQGAIHQRCSSGEASTTVETPSVLPPKVSVHRDAKYYIINVARIYIGIAPIAFGPFYWLFSHDSSLSYCIYIPMGLALLDGFTPTDIRIRVKWGSRRALRADVYWTWILFGAGISFAATWILSLIFGFRLK